MISSSFVTDVIDPATKYVDDALFSRTGCGQFRPPLGRIDNSLKRRASTCV